MADQNPGSGKKWNLGKAAPAPPPKTEPAAPPPKPVAPVQRESIPRPKSEAPAAPPSLPASESPASPQTLREWLSHPLVVIVVALGAVISLIWLALSGRSGVVEAPPIAEVAAVAEPSTVLAPAVQSSPLDAAEVLENTGLILEAMIPFVPARYDPDQVAALPALDKYQFAPETLSKRPLPPRGAANYYDERLALEEELLAALTTGREGIVLSRDSQITRDQLERLSARLIAEAVLLRLRAQGEAADKSELAQVEAGLRSMLAIQSSAQVDGQIFKALPKETADALKALRAAHRL